MNHNHYQTKVFNPRSHSKKDSSVSTATTYIIVGLAMVTIVVFGLFGWLDTGVGNTPLNLTQAVASGGVAIAH